jgi:hypothetical protein
MHPFDAARGKLSISMFLVASHELTTMAPMFWASEFLVGSFSLCGEADGSMVSLRSSDVVKILSSSWSQNVDMLESFF